MSSTSPGLRLLAALCRSMIRHARMPPSTRSIKARNANTATSIRRRGLSAANLAAARKLIGPSCADGSVPSNKQRPGDIHPQENSVGDYLVEAANQLFELAAGSTRQPETVRGRPVLDIALSLLAPLDHRFEEACKQQSPLAPRGPDSLAIPALRACVRTPLRCGRLRASGTT